MKTETLRAGKVERQEVFQFLKRDPRKNWKRVVGLYLLSSQGREIGQAARSGYFFLRHIDDIADGDRRIATEPLPYIKDLRQQVETGNFRYDTPVSALAHRCLDILEPLRQPWDNPTQ